MIENFYKSGSYLQSLFLLIVRLGVGSSFAFSGWGKLQNIDKIVDYLSSLGFSFPTFNAYALGGIEFICGILLFFGLVSRLAGLLLAIVMIVALYTAHHDLLANVYKAPYELFISDTFIFMMSGLLIFIFGPGKVSVDHAVNLE